MSRAHESPPRLGLTLSHCFKAARSKFSDAFASRPAPMAAILPPSFI
jgi:hypothetical protein